MRVISPLLRDSDGADAFAGGAGANAVDAQIDFGTSGNTAYVEVTVAATWALSGTNILIRPGLPTTADHDPEDALIEGVACSVVGINPGVGFTIGVSASEGTWGRYDLVCIGV